MILVSRWIIPVVRLLRPISGTSSFFVNGKSGSVCLVFPICILRSI